MWKNYFADHPVTRKERDKRVKNILQALGISEFSHHLPGELSGGQQQRVAVARALVTNPSLVLADGSNKANMDSESAKRLIDIMEEMNRKLKETFIFSTHDPMVMERAYRLIRLVDGKVTEDKKK